MSHLHLDRLSKAYGTYQAVSELDLSVAKGEFISLLGPSGCGKTTTLQMIAGFVQPSAGIIRLDGTDLSTQPPSKRGMGIVFQSYALFPHMTVAQNVGFGLEMRGVNRSNRDKNVREALALVGLETYADRYPRRMSGGQQQRVALARALVIKPALLLLDEPLSNLDAKLREEMQVELRSIQRNTGTTTILVTHDQAEAMALSDRIVVMNRGVVEQIASPDVAYSQPATPFVASFLGKANILKGECRDGRLMIGGSVLPAGDLRFKGPIVATIRAERISFGPPGAAAAEGIIKLRIFQGSQWLFQVETAAGMVTVIEHNGGSPVPSEEEKVHLNFERKDLQVVEATL